jgi:type II secretory pathway pseudopilin PulG
VSARANESGWTLLELLIAAGIGSILIACIAALSLYGARSFSVIGNFADMDADSRQALDLLSREFRQASAVVNYQTNLPVKWISVTTNAAVGATAKVTWDSHAGTVTLTARGHDRLLLEECDYWDIRLYQRIPVISGTNVAFAGTATTNDCKAIEMSWRCSRTNQGQHFNTESLQRAYLVLRNKVR